MKIDGHKLIGADSKQSYSETGLTRFEISVQELAEQIKPLVLCDMAECTSQLQFEKPLDPPTCTCKEPRGYYNGLCFDCSKPLPTLASELRDKLINIVLAELTLGETKDHIAWRITEKILTILPKPEPKPEVCTCKEPKGWRIGNHWECSKCGKLLPQTPFNPEEKSPNNTKKPFPVEDNPLSCGSGLSGLKGFLRAIRDVDNEDPFIKYQEGMCSKGYLLDIICQEVLSYCKLPKPEYCTCERPKMDVNAEYPNYCLCGKPLPKPEPKPVEVSNCNLKLEVPEKCETRYIVEGDTSNAYCYLKNKINEIIRYLNTKG